MNPLFGSQQIDRLSPSSFERMRTCRLQGSFARSSPRRERTTSPAAAVGEIAHSALETVVRDGSLLTTAWPGHTASAWEAAAASAAERLRDDPTGWPDYELKRARLLRAAGRLRELLISLPTTSRFEPEADLASADGILFGRADLVVRGPIGMVIDYKSGAVLDKETGQLKDGYRRQLQLYAFLESETSGAWPSRLAILPVSGPPVEVDVDPTECRELAADARTMLADYNERVPQLQPASPLPAACRWCDFSPICPAFWGAYEPSWEPVVRAAHGRLKSVIPAGGRVTIAIATADGDLIVRGIDLSDHPDVSAIQVGAEVGVVGLLSDGDRATMRLGPYGHIREIGVVA